jgi:hypothetical protein
MYTRWNSSNSTVDYTTNDSHRLLVVYSSSSSSSSSSSFDTLSSMVLIVILSILCFLGVIFMIFGPIMRSEAWKRVDNYIFGQDSAYDDHDDGETGPGDE